MAEYIIKQKVTDRMGCCLAYAKAEYKAAKDEFTKARFGDYILSIQAMIDVVKCSEAADVQPVSVIKELQEHIKQRILETAFNNGGIYGEVAEDIANRIDIWVDEFRRNKNA